MKRVTKQELLRAAFSGMNDAERKFSSLTSNTAHLNRAPEYLLTVNVAEKLGISAPNHLTLLEFNICQTRSARSGLPPPPPPTHGRGNGRCDILMCWAASKEPRAAFEIKRDVQSLNKIKSDVERILYLMNGGGVDGNTLQFGAVMFNTMAECMQGRHIIKTRVSHFRDQLEEWRVTMGGKKCRLNIISGSIKKRQAGDYWAPLALVAERMKA